MTAERALRTLLIVIGTVLSVAVFAIFQPTSCMAANHARLGLGEFPASTLVDYLTRSIAAVYALHGGVVLLAASDVRRYRGLVLYIGVAHTVFGLVLTGIDLHAGMPLWWMIGEGPMASLAGVVILILARRVERV